jgi:hypothetical protein
MAWTRITINLEPHLGEVAKKRAKSRRQSVASYFASLLEEDIKAHPDFQHGKTGEFGVAVVPKPEILNPSLQKEKRKLG